MQTHGPKEKKIIEEFSIDFWWLQNRKISCYNFVSALVHCLVLDCQLDLINLSFSHCETRYIFPFLYSHFRKTRIYSLRYMGNTQIERCVINNSVSFLWNPVIYCGNRNTWQIWVFCLLSSDHGNMEILCQLPAIIHITLYNVSKIIMKLINDFLKALSWCKHTFVSTLV